MESIYNEEYKEELFKYTTNLLDVIGKKLEIPYDDLLDAFVSYHKQLNPKPIKKIKTINTNNKRSLEYIKIDGKPFLLDSANNFIYTYDKKQKYIGKFEDDNETIILA
jgi:hypothetical protein